MTKNCSSCGTNLTEEMKFCPSCGKAFSDKSSPLNTKDFFKEFINYDPHIWYSVKTLLLKPGTLAREFVNGNQQKLISPVKLFIIISALAFVISNISITKPSSDHINNKTEQTAQSQIKPKLELEFKTDTGVRVNNIEYYRNEIDSLGAEQFLIQRGNRPGGLKFWIIKQSIKKYQLNNFNEISANYQRNASFLLYLLIPIFAFFMKLLRWNRSFTEHITFTLYFFTTFYLLVIITSIVGKVFFYLFSIKYLNAFFIPLSIVYLSISIYKSYGHKWYNSAMFGLITGVLLLISMAMLLFFSSLMIITL